MNILALLAHTEDPAALCGGTLMKYKEMGHSIYIALTTGVETPWGADKLNAQVRLLSFEKGTLRDDMISRPAVLTAIRWANPDLILTHAPWDADTDHAITSKLVADSLLIVGGKLHPADLPPIQKLPHLFYTDTFAGNSLENRYTLKNYRTTDQLFYLTKGLYSNDWFEPEAYVDITPFGEVKNSMIPDEGIRSGCCAQMRLRGIQMGVTYAEGFSGHRMVGHIADYRLLP